MLYVVLIFKTMPMTQNESAIEQINLGFNDQEDRLLLKIGLADKTEVAVWITRRICKAMWGLLQNTNSSLVSAVNPIITTPDNKHQAIENFELEVAEQKKINNMDFKSEYITSRDTRTDEPMLAIQCVVISIENSSVEKSQLPQLELQCNNGQSVKIALSNELVYAVTNMMLLATREAGWDLLMTQNSMQIALNPSQQVLH